MNISNAAVASVLELVYRILDLYIDVLVIGAVLSWLVTFNIINTHNRLVQIIGDFIYRITEPVLRPLRRLVPPIGGMDISPVVLIFIIMFLQSFIRHLVFG